MEPILTLAFGKGLDRAQIKNGEVSLLSMSLDVSLLDDLRPVFYYFRQTVVVGTYPCYVLSYFVFANF
jgi:hypothetical protein